MGLKFFEATILREAREHIPDKKLRQKDIMEWCTTPIEKREDEETYYLPKSRVYIAVTKREFRH